MFFNNSLVEFICTYDESTTKCVCTAQEIENVVYFLKAFRYKIAKITKFFYFHQTESAFFLELPQL